VSVEQPAAGRRVAYLINQYPKTSHSFVRREIRALEELGLVVERYAIRSISEPIVEAADRDELGRTEVLLACGAAALLLASLLVLLRHPLRFATAFWLTMRMARRSDRGLVRPFAWLAEACLLRRRLAATGAQHVHAHFSTNSTAVAMLTHALGGPGYSFTAHGTESFDAPPMISLGLKVERARFVVATSQWGRAQLMRCSPQSSWSKLHVVRCGVDEQFLDHAATPVPERARLVCVARLSAEKGVEVLIDAVQRVARQRSDFEVAIVGDGSLREPIEAQLRAAGIERNVLLRGWGDAEVVRREMCEARALVVPSFGEGLPVVIMESLALGRPVVATAVGAVPELVQPTRTGWLVPPGSAEDLADAIVAALDASPAELQQFGEVGAQMIRRLHDASREAKVLAGLLNEACGG